MAESSGFLAPRSRIGVLLAIAVIVIAAFRVVQIVPDWLSGAAPAYPGQYASRLLNALTIVGIMGATLVNRGTSRGRVAHWVLLATALGSLVMLVLRDA